MIKGNQKEILNDASKDIELLTIAMIRLEDEYDLGDVISYHLIKHKKKLEDLKKSFFNDTLDSR
jgi:hypothetical protein